MTAELALETNGKASGEPEKAPPMPTHVAKDLVHGTSALGLGLLIERGFGFLANLLAARLGGASVFGAYSLALTTATNISSYAAGGIGSTAVRFSGRYSRDSAGYPTLTRVLSIISLVSAAAAAAVLWAGAAPIARLLGKQSLTGLLDWAALSAAGIILLECCRGFLVGQRRLPAILLLSLTVGIGLLALLPFSSRIGPVPMIASQAAVALGAVTLCVLFYRPLGLAAPHIKVGPVPLSPMLREVWSFGLVQLAGLVGMNAAGWWLTTLVARSDTSLVQMGFLAISHQLRNVVGLAPGLLTESSLAVMAQGESGVEKTPDQVMAVCTLATTFVSLLLAGLGMAGVSWGLKLLYGNTYGGAATAIALALATAVIHMGSSPASARLSIVSIKMTGVINTVWAVLVASGATLFFFIGGNAWKGALIYLVAHLVSAALVLGYLNQRRVVPDGMNRVFALGVLASVVLAALAFWRFERPEWTSAITCAMLLISGATLTLLGRLGRRRGWVPSFRFFLKVLQNRGSFPPRAIETSTSGGFDA
jgi:O-antigen/teichoic acid export membrane protein